jgi:predicted  nucleic acid-binding Zn-ribbon protein
MSLVDQLLLPRRLIARALEDLHRIAEAARVLGGVAREAEQQFDPLREWMDATAAMIQSLRDQVAGVRAAVDPMSRDMDALRVEFGRADDEIGRLREAIVPELAAFRDSANGLRDELRQFRELMVLLEADVKEMRERATAEMHAIHDAMRALVRDAHEISDVVEPLQEATDRVGNIASHLPGGRRHQ